MIVQQKQTHVKIRLASSEQIRSWAERILPNGEIVGRVTSNRTIHYKTHRAERDGLFCERIFGPMKTAMCGCAKRRYQSVVRETSQPLYCEQCGVEFTTRQVRRHRMGYIALGSPVTHVWYMSRRPSCIAQLLGKPLKEIENLVTFNDV
jgi:DNA-directed RNA polymerase beta' subunit